MDEALVALLAWQAGRYAYGSSSITADIASELLASLRYTLSMAPPSITSGSDLIPVWRAGQKEIELALEKERELYAAACLGERGLGNLSYASTLRSIGGFQKLYDRLYFAHAVPCDVDYQLLFPVDEAIVGVSYINEYLSRLIIENDLLSRFEDAPLRALMGRYSPSYRELLINLYEPVAAECIGLALLGKSLRELVITPEDKRRLAALFEPLPPSAARAALENAALSAAAELSLNEAGEAYLLRAARELAPRVAAALDSGFEGNGLWP